MTEGLAIEIACGKMHELGIGKNYILRYRHFQVMPLKQIELDDRNDLFILLTPDAETRVFSPSGIYDLKDTGVSEMQYVFSGRITVESLNAKLPVQVRFLQVIALLQNT
jgi:hypothetical protein